jgi:2-dehydro-3-deoxyglucarate aldolase
VDGAMIGPYDLSGSLGIPGQLDHPEVIGACAQVVKACARYGKGCGTHLVDPTEANLHAAFKNGYTFVVLASDVFVLWKWSERMRTLVRAARVDGGG